MKKTFKKGISPLIAAVLLMALVVSIGAVIMTWSKGFVNKQLNSADAKQSSQAVCGKDVSIQLEDVNNQKLICWKKLPNNNISIRYTLTNGPDKELIGLSGRVITTNKVYTDINKIDVAKGETIVANNTFAGLTSIDDLQKFELNAIIRYESGEGLKEITCQDHSIERSLIEECS